jgi:antitoxin component HigA of HigAB toxin-antitoxin module
MEKGALMRKISHKTAFAEIPLDYAALVAMFPPRPIHDSVDYANTLEVVMAMAGHILTRDQEDYLAIQSEMILQYDRDHDQPRKRGLPHQRLQYLVMEAGLSASDLGRLLGNRGMGSLFLSGKRGLSKANIRKLAKHFNVRADYFL